MRQHAHESFLVLSILMPVGLSFTNYSPQKSTWPSGQVQPDSALVSVDGPFDPKHLRGFWGKKPLVIRNAFDFEVLNKGVWISWEDVFSLACPEDLSDADMSPGTSARLIKHIPGNPESYTLEIGPLRPKQIGDKRGNDEKWTILVNDVDRYFPLLSRWMDNSFGFLPRWRRDDAQVSIARTGGGIGPHVDNYDVFLIQSSGSRNWRVSHSTVSTEYEMKTLIPDIPVRILSEDYDGYNVELKPGDLLYLPPRYIHCGTASTDDCITLSVGCRAPSASELVARVADSMYNSVEPSVVRRYTDVDLPLQGSSVGSSITENVKSAMKKLVMDAVKDTLDDSLKWDELVGRLTTEAKRYSDNALMPYDEIDDEYFHEVWGTTPRELVERIQEGKGTLGRIEGISFATSKVMLPNGEYVDRLFANGEMWEVWNDPVAGSTLNAIEKGISITNETLSDAQPALIDTLEGLVAEGLLYAS